MTIAKIVLDHLKLCQWEFSRISKARTLLCTCPHVMMGRIGFSAFDTRINPESRLISLLRQFDCPSLVGVIASAPRPCTFFP